MRSSDLDGGPYKVRTITGFVNNDGSVGSGSFKGEVGRFRVAKVATGTYDIRPVTPWKGFLSGVGNAQAAGVAICQGTVNDKFSCRFITTSSYGQSTVDMPFDFSIQALY